MKPFGKTRMAAQPQQEEQNQPLQSAVRLATLFAQYIHAQSIEEALSEMEQLAAETQEETATAAQPQRQEAPQAHREAAPQEAPVPQNAPAAAAGDLMAKAYQVLEGSMDEEKLDMLMEDETFAALIQAGIAPVVAARCAMMDELLAAAEARGEKRGRTQVKNKLGRVSEVGTSMTNAFRTNIDPDKLSLQEIRDMKKRAGRGETITL